MKYGKIENARFAEEPDTATIQFSTISENPLDAACRDKYRATFGILPAVWDVDPEYDPETQRLEEADPYVIDGTIHRNNIVKDITKGE